MTRYRPGMWGGATLTTDDGEGYTLKVETPEVGPSDRYNGAAVNLCGHPFAVGEEAYLSPAGDRSLIVREDPDDRLDGDLLVIGLGGIDAVLPEP